MSIFTIVNIKLLSESFLDYRYAIIQEKKSFGSQFKLAYDDATVILRLYYGFHLLFIMGQTVVHYNYN